MNAHVAGAPFRRSPSGALTAVLTAAALVLIAASLQMAAESAGWLQRPSGATGDFAGHGIAKAASGAALFVAAAAAFGRAFRPGRERLAGDRLLGQVVAPLAAAAAVVRSLTYDPYHLPAERRFVDVH